MTWQPELPVDASASREELLEWLERQFRTLSDWTAEAAGTLVAHGGLENSSGGPMPNIGTGAWTIIPFNAGLLTTPINVTQDPGNNQIKVLEPGVYLSAFWGELQHDSSGSFRNTYIRVFNATKATLVGSQCIHALQMNTGATNMGFAELVEITSAAVGDALQLELGGLAALNNINFIRAVYSITRSGPIS